MVFSDLKRGETNCLGSPPKDQPLGCCGSQGGLRSSTSSVPEARLSWAAGEGFFFCFRLDLQSMAFTAMPEVDLEGAGYGPSFLSQQGILTRGAVMSQA